MLGGRLNVPSTAVADALVGVSTVVVTMVVKSATEAIGNFVPKPPTEAALARRKQSFAKYAARKKEKRAILSQE